MQLHGRDEVAGALARGGVVEHGGRVYRAQDRLPEQLEGPALLLRDQRGRLTRAGMEKAIRERGSVLYRYPNGESVIIESVDRLPDEAELVRHDERQRAALAASLDEQIATLTRRRARLDEEEDEGPLPGDRPPPRDADREVATQRAMVAGELRDIPAVPDVRHSDLPGGPEEVPGPPGETTASRGREAGQGPGSNAPRPSPPPARQEAPPKQEHAPQTAPPKQEPKKGK